MSSFVTGATGFIGRFLVERLLARGEEVHVLVREASAGKLDRLGEQWGAMDRVHPVIGDLTAARLGVQDDWIAGHTGEVEHFFHLAAMYDMTASEEANRAANVGGTRHAVELANTLDAGCLHHVSSVAAAGLYEGTFTEDMFDEGQPLDHPYHATKHESEGIARTESTVPWRVYRPAVVVGHSQTGEMDKIDGPYYFFKAIKLGARLPDLLPLIGPNMGETNVVPVDFVVDAMDHIAHLPNLDGRAFHLVNYEPQRSSDVINAFSRAAGAPRLTEALPSAVLSAALAIPGVRGQALPRLGVPGDVVDYIGFTCRFDASRTEAALAGSGVIQRPLDEYADVLWRYWSDHLA